MLWTVTASLKDEIGRCRHTQAMVMQRLTELTAHIEAKPAQNEEAQVRLFARLCLVTCSCQLRRPVSYSSIDLPKPLKPAGGVDPVKKRL